jgi:hypothetical protein
MLFLLKLLTDKILSKPLLHRIDKKNVTKIQFQCRAGHAAGRCY